MRPVLLYFRAGFINLFGALCHVRIIFFLWGNDSIIFTIDFVRQALQGIETDISRMNSIKYANLLYTCCMFCHNRKYYSPKSSIFSKHCS